MLYLTIAILFRNTTRPQGRNYRGSSYSCAAGSGRVGGKAGSNKNKIIISEKCKLNNIILIETTLLLTHSINHFSLMIRSRYFAGTPPFQINAGLAVGPVMR